LDKYLALRKLQKEDEDAFYAILMEHTEDVLPYVYTPTVGEACQKYSHLPIETKGLFITADDRGRILEKLQEWPRQNIRVVVVTDGERILGLGDLGAGGMGISEGKILLYTAAAGVNPEECLPICLDVGTNNESLLRDPGYRGLKQRRLTGEEYHSFVDEFISAIRVWQPHLLLQFEDFGNHNAFDLLHNYREKLCCFNDDIQGTAAITLSAILASLRLKKERLVDQTILFHGAGEAGVGCGELIAIAMSKWYDISINDARKKVLFLDSKGMVCASRINSLQEHKKAFAHDVPFEPDLLSAVRTFKPNILIGVSTVRGAFSADVIKEMAASNDRPIIFPLSNPTSKSECTFEEAFHGTEGRVLFASGSPFPPLESTTGTFYPAQANNAYIFPAIGHAAVLCKASYIPDGAFVEAARCLSEMSSEPDLAVGRLMPPFSNIRDVSATIMAHIAEYLCSSNFGTKPEEVKDWKEFSRKIMYQSPKL